MPRDASELAHRLARDAEAVCRHYLSNGRCEGRYWLIGDVRNTPGRTMFVRLKGPESGRGAVGKWTDAATGEHGDLLDVIRESCGLLDFREVADEARRFLSLPRSDPEPSPKTVRMPAQTGSPEAPRRLFVMSQPLARTLAEAYLRNRGITPLHEAGSLRFHPRCYYRPDDNSPTETWPAMIARVTDLEGRITGAHRTWLDPNGFDPIRLGKAPIDTPRRAMGDLLGNAVRFGVANDVLAAGEGIETMLSLRCVLPSLPMAAALSANHLAAMLLPLTLRRLYIARDADAAGDAAVTALTERADAAGIEAITWSPRLGDFNEDVRTSRSRSKSFRSAFRTSPIRAPVNNWSRTALAARIFGCFSNTRTRRESSSSVSHRSRFSSRYRWIPLAGLSRLQPHSTAKLNIFEIKASIRLA
jgi:Toprim domain